MTKRVGFCGDSNCTSAYIAQVGLSPASYTTFRYSTGGAMFASTVTSIHPTGVEQVASALADSCAILVVAFGTNDVIFGGDWDIQTGDETTLDVVTPCHQAIDQASGVAQVLLLQPPLVVAPYSGTNMLWNLNGLIGAERDQLRRAFPGQVIETPWLNGLLDYTSATGLNAHVNSSGHAKIAAVVQAAILALG